MPYTIPQMHNEAMMKDRVIPYTAPQRVTINLLIGTGWVVDKNLFGQNFHLTLTSLQSILQYPHQGGKLTTTKSER